MRFVNLTPHTINVQGLKPLEPCGQVARVETARAVETFVGGVRLVRTLKLGVIGLPAPSEGTVFVVSGMVLDALQGSRPDVVAPDTGADAIRNEKGHIVAVRGFV